MLVDRNELEAQLFGNLEAGGGGTVERARSNRHLVELLKNDQRGLLVSMIHKFDDVPAKINLRENIFILVDEAHRTTGGELGNYLMGALPNATYIGFTGTPIDKTAHGKGTFKTFGTEDEQGYLDKYSIRESIEDRTTVPLHYALAPNELLVNRETLEKEFLRLAILDGVSDVEVLNRVLERAVTLKNMLKNPDRISEVAQFVAEHFLSTVDPAGYKAFLVAPDREGCTLYKEELDKHLPPEYSKVVMSAAHNDPPELAKFHLQEEEEKRIRNSFRGADELPKILIVTEKLLTGYDAPILYCMYLDKPMRDHVLLQAIARVNRPYEDEERRKPAGFILDFVGMVDREDMKNNVKDGWVEVDGLRVHYLKAGEGNAPVLLLHGGGYDSASLSYKHAIDPISEYHQVFAPDWPGYGGSDKPKMEYTTDYYVGFLERLMDALGLEKASLVGISMGGAISLGFTLSSPQRVEKLVLVDSHGLGGEVPGGVASYVLVRLPLLNRLVWAALKRSRKIVKQSLQTVFYDSQAVTEDLVDEVYQLMKKPGAGQAWRSWQKNEIGWKGLHTNFVDRLPTLTVLTLILHGEEDKYVPVSWARRADTLINDSELHVFPRCGHWLTLERPGEFNTAVLEFLVRE